MEDRIFKRDRKYQFVIVGSGAGGATLAMELARRREDVLILERGKNEQQFGELRDIARFYDINKSSLKTRISREGVIIFRAFMAGGTTVVSCGNGIRSLENELKTFGIYLEEEFSEAEKEMRIAPLADRCLSAGSFKLKWAAESLGYNMRMMPKFINASQCQKCGKCIAGCPSQAKWSAREYLDEAVQKGAQIAYEKIVRQVIIKHGRIKGLSVIGPQGEDKIYANTVILSAGGLGTPLILNASGIEEAGKKLFLDLFVNTFGESRGINQLNEPVMAMVNDEFLANKGFIISPFINRWKIGRFSEMGKKGLQLKNENLIGLMSKIADQSVGRVFPDGNISKSVTERDWKRLKEGTLLAKEIMIKAGVEKESLVQSSIQGAHPGGSAAIGEVVDKNLQTAVDNLFVCDASVLPVAPGLPPILTIVALAKRLAKILSP